MRACLFGIFTNKDDICVFHDFFRVISLIIGVLASMSSNSSSNYSKIDCTV